MKFDEVTTQFVLTRHVIGYDVMAIRAKIWDEHEARAAGQIPGRGRQGVDANTTKFDAQETDAIEYFKKEGKKVYTPDQNAFRTFAQKRYVDKYGNDWPKGALERINAIK